MAHSLLFTRKSIDEPSNTAVEYASTSAEVDVPIVISCTNEEGDENVVDTCHVPLGLRKSDPLRSEPRKKFGSFACGHRKFSTPFSSTAQSRTRKSLPLNLRRSELSETVDLTQNFRAAYFTKLNMMSRHNSVVPQIFNINKYETPVDSKQTPKMYKVSVRVHWLCGPFFRFQATVY
ncbi:hypothetical protein NPIL_700231 [Nephila pilipes]|uniref:Uncharacterized protein n=1 Tax=Nephila pilipes TaxID=299642 RepID=A0A8X6P0S9_NEPPI|nr:hypothetical protein NPIL_700231 [Nephila pilipes]